MTIERFDPFDGGFGFALATRHGSIVHTCGMVGFDPETGVAPEDFEDEVRLVFSNLANILEGVGTSLEHVVEETNFLVGDAASVYPIFNKVRAEVFAGCLPASTSVFVQALVGPQNHCEIKLVAVIP